MTTDDVLDLHSDEAERALIGAVAYHADACAGVLAGLHEREFLDPHRETVWAVMRELNAARNPITPGHIRALLKSREAWTAGTARVVQVEMADAYPAHQAFAHADLVRDLAARRDILRRVTRIQQISREDHYEPSELLGRMRAVFDEEIAGRMAGDAQRPLRWRELLEEFEREHDPTVERRRVPTPWTALDNLLGGLYPSRMYVFGGRPGQGKSTAAFNIAAHAAYLGHETLICSREMPSVDVTGRVLARGSDVNLKAINARDLSASEMQKIRAHAEELGDLTLTVDAHPRNLTAVKTLARAHKHRHGLDLLVVDYLQLVHTDQPSRTREQEVAQVSMQLKRLALELDIVVALPAQLNRGSTQRADPKPNMSDLRDSGQIEQDADVVTLLHRTVNGDGEPTGKILFIVDKNRHGPTAELELSWYGGYGEIS